MSYFKKKLYIHIYIYIYIYGVSPDVSILGGPVSYRPGFRNLERFPRFVQLSVGYSSVNEHCSFQTLWMECACSIFIPNPNS
jgi:hypothetical protein